MILEVKEMKQLGQLVVGVNQKNPDATIDVWIRELTLANQRLESMALADQMETYFDLDIAIQVEHQHIQHLDQHFIFRFFCSPAFLPSTLLVKANLI